VDAGVITDRQLAETLAEQLNLPLADLRNESPAAEAVAKVPERVARELVAVPLRLDGNDLHMVIADPTPQTLRLLQETTRLNIIPLVASYSEVSRVIDATYRAVGAIEGLVQAFAATDGMRRGAAQVAQVTGTVGAAGSDADAPVVKVVNLLVAQALAAR